MHSDQTGIVIRRATQGDLSTIEALAHRIWRVHYPGIITMKQIQFMLDRDYSRDQLQHDLDTGIAIDLLSVEGEPGGFAGYGPLPRRKPDHAKSTEAKLHKLYLDVSLHGRGLGSTLLQHVEHECIGAGVSRLLIGVNKHNATAIRAYKRNGYEVADSVLNAIGGGFFMDDFIMAKNLG